jgi:hypothetical protein
MKIEYSKFQKIILTVLKDGKKHSCKQILSILPGDSMVVLKEELLTLLKKEQVCCHGSYWQLIPDIVPHDIDVDLNETDLCVRSPKCQELLDCSEIHAGHNIACPTCFQRFRIGSEKLSPSQYRSV